MQTILRLTFVLCAAGVFSAGCAGQQDWTTSTGADSQAGLTNLDEAWYASADRPPTPRTLFAMAQILVAQQRDNEAQFVLTRINQDYPEYMPAYVELAELQMRQRRLEEAIDTLNKALVLRPDDPVLINDLGMCWLIKGEHEKALGYFEKAAAVNPSDARWRANMAVALGTMARYDESLALYMQILPPADAHYNVGVLAESRGDKERAEHEFEMATILREEAKKKQK